MPRESERKTKLFADIVNAFPEPIVAMDLQGRFTFVNDCAEEMLGCRSQDLLGKEIWDFSLGGKKESEELRKILLPKGGARNCYTFPVRNNEGKIIYVEGNFRRLMEGKEISGMVGVLRDVTRKVKDEQELLELSITDGLTGLYNQRHFYRQLDKEMERARGEQATFSLLLFDLDDFKAFNDRYGHLEGDKVLKNVSEAVLKSIRKIDSAYRYGGDEFTIILPGARDEHAAQVAARLRRTFQNQPFLKEIRLSIGIVEFHPSYDLAAFVRHADEAMYAAKSRKGNQVHIFAAGESFFAEDFDPCFSAGQNGEGGHRWQRSGI